MLLLAIQRQPVRNKGPAEGGLVQSRHCCGGSVVLQPWHGSHEVCLMHCGWPYGGGVAVPRPLLVQAVDLLIQELEA